MPALQYLFRLPGGDVVNLEKLCFVERGRWSYGEMKTGEYLVLAFEGGGELHYPEGSAEAERVLELVESFVRRPA
jgi:hypothetical protein